MNKEIMGLRDRIALSIKEVKGEDKKELRKVLRHYNNTGRIDNVTLLHRVGIKV